MFRAGVFINVMFCAIWYHLYNFKNVKNTHGGVLLLVKLQDAACNFTKSNTPPCMFFAFFKLYKWHQIAQRTTNTAFTQKTDYYWNKLPQNSSTTVILAWYLKQVLKC